MMSGEVPGVVKSELVGEHYEYARSNSRYVNKNPKWSNDQ